MVLNQNIKTFREYIEERNVELMNPRWVLWMLDILDELDGTDRRINPEWLRATHIVWILDGNPPPEDEPAMEIVIPKPRKKKSPRK